MLGPGTIGLLAAQVARCNGGHVHVRGATTDEARLALARDLGFDTSTADQPFSGDAPDVVIECSGAEPAIATALEVIARGGSLVQMGLRGAPVTVPFDEICFKELRVRSGFAANPVAWHRALRLLAGGAIQLEPLISGVAELADFARLFVRSRGATASSSCSCPSDAAPGGDSHPCRVRLARQRIWALVRPRRLCREMPVSEGDSNARSDAG